MDQSLSITLILEGGLPSLYLNIQDNYNSPAQVFSAPLELIDFNLLVDSAQTTGDYYFITASPDNPRFQLESAIFVKHHDGKILWDLVYEHYEPFLNIELEEADTFEESIITFSFDPFQYVSALYQAAQLCNQLQTTTFLLSEKHTQEEHPLNSIRQQTSRLQLLWQKYGQTKHMIKDGQPTQNIDPFARNAETQWLQELLETLDSLYQDNMMDNTDAYLDSLPDELVSQFENNSQQLQEALLKRWEMLVDSLTEEEADALENAQTSTRFPNSLKLRLMREFLEGNPSILLGNPHYNAQTNGENVVDIQHWKRRQNNDQKL
ncbi:MAG: hypothetical protein CR991_06270 [Proteobacteria bacterium]|nr:MAG: hypothetical protein CR991_06270 [Pseudomonadota bacterium]